MRWLASIKYILLFMFTFSYHGSLRHYTLDRLFELERQQNDHKVVKLLLQTFKRLKIEEQQLVRKGAALSAAIVIGTFSWPTSSEVFWLSRLFWYCSLWFSVFALVGFSHQRLIDALPGQDLHVGTDAFEKTQIESALRLVLSKRSNTRPQQEDPENGPYNQRSFVFDWALAYVWQYPLMLLSYSWLFFLLGYGIYILNPMLPEVRDSFEVGCAGIGIGVGVLTFFNFEITSWAARRAVRRAGLSTEQTDAGGLCVESKTQLTVVPDKIHSKATQT